MEMPPMRGMGLVWNLRIWSGRSTKPQRIARFRHSGVRANATQKDEMASMSSEYTARSEFRNQEAKTKKLKTSRLQRRRSVRILERGDLNGI